MSILGRFGNTDSTHDSGFDLRTNICFGRFQMDARKGKAVTISALLSTVVANAGTGEFALYDDSLNFLGNTSQVAVPTVQVDYFTSGLTAPYILNPGAFYYLAVWGSNDGAQPIACGWKNSAGDHVYVDNLNVYDAWPNPIVKDQDFADYLLMVWLDYDSYIQDAVLTGFAK